MSDLESLEFRIKAIEDRQSEQMTIFAVRAERDRHMDRRFDRLEESVGEIKGYLLRIVWVIVIGIVASLMTFIVGGGLNFAP
jgi:hypothetical protein